MCIYMIKYVQIKSNENQCVMTLQTQLIAFFFLQIHIIPCAISSSILIESAIRYINIEEGHCKGTIVHFIDNAKYFN